mmetsp:Transcript_10790/g.26728  ORF Transcript_10790/g.26728 Transcript_10790/m.26728 type:complete len:226 (-) Transcript_10790:1309-1986(-)|eukprot:CAMPEP_0173421600 /NCGR_PEP_ID=MMETSP1357-20121228/2656_1 /TAXON_ID=77926 /ORGANISM="Hemiselmis rufescens, Strain PCC563" /LENGTH=225 /DNA_ID=CAMNT_0014384535 /DNA_START=167 /DNA_END=844 /DNA_ORIENTATION=-
MRLLLMLVLAVSAQGFVPISCPITTKGGFSAGSRIRSKALVCSAKPPGDDWEEYASGEDEKGGTRSDSFKLPTLKDKDQAWGVFGLEKAAQSARPQLLAEDMTTELFQRILRVSIDALDNYPPQEVARKLDLLWSQGPAAGPEGESLKALAQLTANVEDIEEAAMQRVKTPGADLYDLEDAIRMARSQVRTNIQHSDFYDPDHWLSQGDVSQGSEGWFNFFGGKS